MIELIAAALILTGTALAVLAAVGVVRMPDFYSRLQASSKASTLGVGCIVAAAALKVEEPGSLARVLLVGAFLGLTTPIAAHMISRAAYAERVPVWQPMIDELASSPHATVSHQEEGTDVAETH